MMNDPKTTFKKDFDNLFNEIWLTLILCDFWFIFPWRGDMIAPGMMFKFDISKTDEESVVEINGMPSALDIFRATSRLAMSVWIDELFVVTSIENIHAMCVTIRFRPNCIDVNDPRVWNHASYMVRIGCRYYMACGGNYDPCIVIKSIGYKT
jgi:hypothetical protein